MRLYFLPTRDWLPGTQIEPVRIECNEWGTHNASAGLGSSHASFRKLPEERAVQRWGGDEAAWADAKAQAVELGQLKLAYLLAANSQPVAMIRLDYMVKKIGPGKARLVFGEFCEMGACCLGWQEGPPTIWRAALDAALA